MAFDFLKLKITIGDIQSQFKSSMGKLERLKQRRDEVIAAPLAKEDVIAIISERIDAEADAYPNRLMENLNRLISDGNSQDLEQYPLYALMPAQANHGSQVGDASVLFSRLAPFLREPFKDAINTAILGVEDWPPGAISKKDREAELRKLDSEILTLERQLESFKTDAAQAGVLLDY